MSVLIDRLEVGGGPFRRKMMEMEKTKGSVMMETAETRKRKLMKKTEKKKKKLMKKTETKKKKTTPVAKCERMSKEKSGVFIPGDIVSEILLRLPARSLGKFRCVSKSWLSITSNTAFVRANAQRNRIAQHSFVIGDVMMPIELFLAFPDANSKSTIRLQEFRPLENMPTESRIFASCDGLVCLGSFNNGWYCVINPLTGDSTALPKDGAHLNRKLGFYFHRSTSKYRLIRFSKTMYENEVLVVGESSWRRIPSNLPAFIHLPHPLDLNGNIYWLAHSNKQPRYVDPPDTVVIFDEEQEVYSVISLPPLEKLHDLGGNLIDFNGELGLWVLGKDNAIDVWIMKNFWIKRYSVNSAHIHGCPSQFRTSWILGGAVTVGDEELLVNPSKSERSRYLVRCNLKSGACVVQNLMASFCHIRYSTFPYTETLTNPNIQHPHNSEDP